MLIGSEASSRRFDDSYDDYRRRIARVYGCRKATDRLTNSTSAARLAARPWVRGMLDGSVITETGFTDHAVGRRVHHRGVTRFTSPPSRRCARAGVAGAGDPSESFEGVRDLRPLRSATFERPGWSWAWASACSAIGTAMLAAILVALLVTVATWWWLNPI